MFLWEFLAECKGWEKSPAACSVERCCFICFVVMLMVLRGRVGLNLCLSIYCAFVQGPEAGFPVVLVHFGLVRQPGSSCPSCVWGLNKALNAKWNWGNWVHWLSNKHNFSWYFCIPPETQSCHKPGAAPDLQDGAFPPLSGLMGQGLSWGTVSPGTGLSSRPGTPRSLPGTLARGSNSFTSVAEPTSSAQRSHSSNCCWGSISPNCFYWKCFTF